MANSARDTEIDKLWAAVKRDYFGAVEALAGLRSDEGDRRWQRLLRNWRALCAMDMDRAALLAHGFREISAMFDANHRGRADSHLQQLDEMHDAVRAAIPATDAAAFGAMYALGEEALQRRIDEDPSHL